MTVLGAVLYGGFFALAALWLFMSAEGGGGPVGSDAGQSQRQDRSNATNASAAGAGSSPCLASHSSQK